MRASRFATARAIALRLLAAGAGAGAMAGLASAGMTLTTQSEFLNLLFEPLSLLFLPGITVAMAWTTALNHLQKHTRTLADNHEFSPSSVMVCTLLFYFVVLYWFLERRARTAAAGSL